MTSNTSSSPVSEREEIESLKAELEVLKKKQSKVEEKKSSISDVRPKDKLLASKDRESAQSAICKAKERKEISSSKHGGKVKEKSSLDDPSSIGMPNPSYEMSDASLLDERTLLGKEHLKDPIDHAQMELMNFQTLGSSKVTRLSSLEGRDMPGTTIDSIVSEFSNASDKVLELKTPPKDPFDINEMMSTKSTDSDQESNSVKISAEFTGLHRQIAELLSNNEALQREKSFLQRKVQKLSGERREILKINHMWEEQHQRIMMEHKSAMKEQQNRIIDLRRQISEENKLFNVSKFGEQEVELINLKQRLQELQEENRSLQKELAEGQSARHKLVNTVSSLEHLQVMLDEEKKEKELITQREKHSQQQIRAMEATIEVLEAQIQAGISRRRLLEDEVRRLAQVINVGHNSTSPGSKEESSDSNGGRYDVLSYSREHSAEQREQIELLKHQISTYTEDFKCERDEKEKVMEENGRLKTELKSCRDKVATLYRQVLVYENNFKHEREERVRLMRLTGQLPPETPKWEMITPVRHYTPYFDPSDLNARDVAAKSPSDVHGKVVEYCKLAEQKEQISHRMNELELLGVNSQRLASSSGEQRKVSPQPQRRMSSLSSRASDVVPDSDSIPRTRSFDNEIQVPSSPKIPNTCPRCGLLPQSKKEFLSHLETCYVE